MAKFSASHFKSQIRQAQRKAERQLKNELNQASRKIERDINREIRNYNSKMQHNRQIVLRELKKLQTHSTMTIRSSYTISLDAMQKHYVTIGNVYQNESLTPQQEYILNLIEQEQANGLITANVVENNDFPAENTDDIEIGAKLQHVSDDLNNRWKGAVFAINPQNPDAARHFCTSAREIFTEFIELKAPDDAVFQYNPNCQKTNQGNATRREKIKYMMRNSNMDESVISFAESDITNILELFHVLSDGTHGPAGRYSYQNLLQVKKRVEQHFNQFTMSF